MAVNCHVGMLGTELGSLVRAVSVLNHLAIFPASSPIFSAWHKIPSVRVAYPVSLPDVQFVPYVTYKVKS